jgi:hypothetical protein
MSSGGSAGYILKKNAGAGECSLDAIGLFEES